MKLFYKKSAIALAVLSALPLSVCAADVAEIDGTIYESLETALSAADAGATVKLLADAEMNASVTLDKAITLDLNGKTVTNNSATTRPFFVTADAFTVIGNGGSMVIPEDNSSSYGLIDMQTANATLTVSDVTMSGPTNTGAFIKCRKEFQTVNLTNVNAKVTGNSYGIVNAQTGNYTPLNLNVVGGNFEYNSTYTQCGPFAATSGKGSFSFENVTVNSNQGPIVDVCGSTSSFKNCNFTNTSSGSSHYATCIGISSYVKSAYGVSEQGNVIIEGGNYTANYPVYVFNSGGKVTINGGTFDGSIASIKIDNNQQTDFTAEATVTDGTFNGPVSIGSEASLQVEAGKFNTELDEKYLAPSCKLQPTTDGEGNIIYEVVPSTSGIDSVETAPVTDGAVYNMQGIKVADSVDGLPAGLYITGGKKILVK